MPRFNLLTCLLAVASFGAAAPLDVPFVRQVGAGCGSAAIAMVMQYWTRLQPGLDSVAADAERIDRELPATPNGLYGRELKQYLESHGFEAFAFNGELSDLRTHLSKGRPVLVCLGMRGPHAPLHFVVVTGIEDDAVVFNDPARAKSMRESTDRFLRDWKATGNWALLAVPHARP
jgi:predicted double-glycine peptidase